MKLVIYGDAHFSLNSSILVGSTNSLEGRLNHLIKSFSWMYDIAKSEHADAIIDLGDLVDSHSLRAEEITAVAEALSYNPNIHEYHILGNHERVSSDGTINSVNFLSTIPNHELIKDIVQLTDKGFTFIPHGHYNDGDFDDLMPTKYAFTHIDIVGADTGTGWSIKSGVSPTYLSSKFDFVVNGHIHTHGYIINNEHKKVLNLGSISGQNFSSRGTPNIGVLDTDTGEIKFIPNPHALYFINKTCNTVTDVLSMVASLDSKLDYAIQLKVPMDIIEDARKILNSKPHVVSSRLRIQLGKSASNTASEEIDRVNTTDGGFSKLREFIDTKETLPYDKSEVLKVIQELENNRLA